MFEERENIERSTLRLLIVDNVIGGDYYKLMIDNNANDDDDNDR